MNAELIQFRPVVRGDLRTLYVMQQDEAGNQLAGTKTRSWEAFAARWEAVLIDPRVTARAIVVGAEILGAINVIPDESCLWLGYWIDRQYWGRGVASAAVRLMLREVTPRPIFARVATHNPASLRVLKRNGFVEIERQYRAATERFVACEVITLRLV
ncbi:MAG: GNAT family N-acetyltransferase [Phycisphaerales bacterium]|nr:GNAT family N-acetyltransferase [Phycisphaerales bacterium]